MRVLVLDKDVEREVKRRKAGCPQERLHDAFDHGRQGLCVLVFGYCRLGCLSSEDIFPLTRLLEEPLRLREVQQSLFRGTRPVRLLQLDAGR